MSRRWLPLGFFVLAVLGPSRVLLADDVACGGCQTLVCACGTGELALREPVRFAARGAQILDVSRHLLDALASTLTQAGAPQRVRVEVHTDSMGATSYNLELSRRRAAAVRDELARRGVDPRRIEAWGCGESRPRAPNQTPEGRRANRRVELYVLEPAPPSAPPPLAGCARAD